MKKIKLDPGKRYVFYNDFGVGICLDSLSEESYYLEDMETYIAVNVYDDDNHDTKTYVLYVQATTKDVL